MKILLDESLPKPLINEFKGYSASTVIAKGWAGKKNGELLRLAQKEFDVFVTADQNLQHQQNVRGYNIAIVVLLADANRFENLKPLIPKVCSMIPYLKRGEVVQVR